MATIDAQNNELPTDERKSENHTAPTKRVLRAMVASVVLIGAMMLATTQPAAAATKVALNNAGDLIITGDSGPQVVIITRNFSDLFVTVETGQTSTQYVFGGPVRDLRVNLRGGDDGFHVYDTGASLVSRDLIVNMGSGLNASEIHDTVVNRNYRFTDGNGSSSLELGQFGVEGKTWIRMGGGDNRLKQSTSTYFKDVTISTSGSGQLDLDTTDVNFAGKYRLTTGNKVDELRYRDTDLQGKAIINTRGGDDLIDIRADTRLRNGADIRTGSGNDRTTVFGTHVSGSYRFRGENGNDVYSTTATRYDNAVTLDGGGGQDQLAGEATVFSVTPKILRFEIS